MYRAPGTKPGDKAMKKDFPQPREWKENAGFGVHPEKWGQVDDDNSVESDTSLQIFQGSIFFIAIALAVI